MPSMAGFKRHNHAACIKKGLAAAEARCREAGLKFTPVRRRVLAMLLERHTSLGAYEILEQLRAEGHGGQPPMVYRALDFLVKIGLVHRIERLNAFIACSHVGAEHTPMFLICRSCEQVTEACAEDAGSGMANAAREAGFDMECAVMEAVGVCPECVEDSACAS